MLHEESSFKGLKDFNIYYQKWLPPAGAKAVLLVSHGFAEHSGRYNNVVDYFLPKGYAVYALDQTASVSRSTILMITFKT
jgi:acylglycerol lipase